MFLLTAHTLQFSCLSSNWRQTYNIQYSYLSSLAANKTVTIYIEKWVRNEIFIVNLQENSEIFSFRDELHCWLFLNLRNNQQFRAGTVRRACGGIFRRRSYETGSLWIFSSKVVHWQIIKNIVLCIILKKLYTKLGTKLKRIFLLCIFNWLKK